MVEIKGKKHRFYIKRRFFLVLILSKIYIFFLIFPDNSKKNRNIAV